MKNEIILIAVILLCLIGAAVFYYQKKILLPKREKVARDEKDKRDTEKLQQILMADNPGNPPLHISCHTGNQHKNITISTVTNNNNTYQVRGIKELGESKSNVHIFGKIKEIPDLAGTNIEGLSIGAQDFAIHLDQLAAMPNIKSFSFESSADKLIPPTRSNLNITFLAVRFPEDGSFDPWILSWYPNLKGLVLGSLSGVTTDFTCPDVKLSTSVELIVFYGKFRNYLNLVKACPKVRHLTLKEGQFDLAVLEEIAPSLMELIISDCTITNPQVLQHLPALVGITFRGYSPQEVKKMTQNLSPKVKVHSWGKPQDFR